MNDTIITVDLHSHSGYSGGVGTMDLGRLAENLLKKGISVFGSGDILHRQWRDMLRRELTDCGNGLFSMGKTGSSILLQTEIILTAPWLGDPRLRKKVHAVLTFPSFDSAIETARIMEERGFKLTVGRPFCVFPTVEALADFLHTLRKRVAGLEVIPAHVFTPDGIFGGENRVFFLVDFFGSFAPEISVVETGLSADPAMVRSVPELSGLGVMSNSDAHSEALNRIGREYTAIATNEISYHGIIGALRSNHIAYTVEFHPEHGRYYLTGHRAERHTGGEAVRFHPDELPAEFLCPVCGRKMTPGVSVCVESVAAEQRRAGLQCTTGSERPFHRQIPLLDLLTLTVQHGKSASKKSVALYEKIISLFSSERNLYSCPKGECETLLRTVGDMSEVVLNAVSAVRNGSFTCIPGFDGEYGTFSFPSLT